MKSATISSLKLTSAALLLGLCNLAHATPSLYAANQVSASSPWGDADTIEFGTPVGNAVQLTTQQSSAGVSAGATSRASYGYAGALAYGGNQGGPGTTFAHALAGFEDSITLVNDALTGQTGEVTLRFSYNYSSAFTGFERPDAQVDGFVNFAAYAGAGSAALSDYSALGSFTGRSFSKEDAFGFTDVFDGTRGVLTIVTQFQWGEAFDIGFAVDALGSSTSPDAAEFSFLKDAGQSGYWDGVQSILTNGSLVDSFSIVSASGTDYSRSFTPEGDVPEPAGYLLLLAGAAMLVSVRKLKRR